MRFAGIFGELDINSPISVYSVASDALSDGSGSFQYTYLISELNILL